MLFRSQFANGGTLKGKTVILATGARWRDMGVFVMIGVYAFSIIDAYVDASLSEFDISDDLTLRVEPAFMNSNPQSRNPFRSGTLGLQCSLTF